MPANAPITAHYNAVSAGQSPAREIESLLNHFNHDTLFHLNIAQEKRRRELRAKFSSGFSGKVFLTQRTLGRAEVNMPGIEICFVEDGGLARHFLNGDFRNAILIANNNDIIQANSYDTYVNFFQKAHDTIAVAWNFDNHHWYPMSTFFASHSDICFPVHPDYMSLLSRYNRCIFGPVCSGVIQWTRSFIRENLRMITSTARSDEPLGMHILYDQFRFRNQVINTLAQHYPGTVGFQTAAFHQVPEADRLRQWCSHKAHWIVPVLNDIPTRLFDALTTGGVPIVPDTFRYHPVVASLAAHVVFYRATDIVLPQSVVQAANSKFNAGGMEKILERHRVGIEQHHVSARIETILKTVLEEFEIPRPSPASPKPRR